MIGPARAGFSGLGRIIRAHSGGVVRDPAVGPIVIKNHTESIKETGRF